MDYVERLRRNDGSLPSWSELLRLWNRDNPQWRYDNVNTMYKAWDRARGRAS